MKPSNKTTGWIHRPIRAVRLFAATVFGLTAAGFCLLAILAQRSVAEIDDEDRRKSPRLEPDEVPTWADGEPR